MSVKMFGDTEDDDVFHPAAGAKLAALFDNPVKCKNTTNETLTYTPPRQPKAANDSPAKQKPQSAVVCAKAVTLYKSIDGKYTLQGKYGFALIGNDDLKTYELIVYKDKQNILVRAKIGASFTYNLLRDNYASFFDDQQQNWSALFDNTADYNEFCAELKKRNVRVVEETKAASADDNNNSACREELKKEVLARLARIEQATSVEATCQNFLSDDCLDSDSEQSLNFSRRLRKPKRPHVPTNKPDLSQPKTNNAQVVPITSQQQHIVLPAMDPVGLLLAENRTHNCEVRMTLNEISSKLSKVLQKTEENQTDATTTNLRDKKIMALELKVATMQSELEEVMNDNIDLHKKVLNTKRNEITEQLEKRLQENQTYIEFLEAENKSLKLYRTFAEEVAHCSNLSEIKDVVRSKQYEAGDKLLNNMCQTLNKTLVVNDVKATNFVGKLTTVMDDFEKYIINHYNTASFVSKLLPKTMTTAKKHLIKEFEKDFKIDDEESQPVFKPTMILSPCDD